MTRYLVLVKFTEDGIEDVQDSIKRAKAFDAKAESAGCKVESQYWTLGAYDGAFVLSAPDESTAAAVVLSLGKADNVSTQMLRAFDAGEFEKIVNKMP